jgi:hypothetical protein
MGKLELDFNEGFQCPQCGPKPDTVVMDGVGVALKRSFLPTKSASQEVARLDGR